MDTLREQFRSEYRWYEKLFHFLRVFPNTRSTFRVHAPDREGVADRQRLHWSYLWSALNANVRGVKLHDQGLAEVTFRSNLLLDLISVLTLGLVCPKIVRWKTSEARPTLGTVHTQNMVRTYEPDLHRSFERRAPVFECTGQTWWIEPNPHEFKREVGEIVDVWNGTPEVSNLDDYNAMTRALQERIGKARDAGKTVRVMGGGWSYSRVLEADDELLNLRPLTYQFRVLKEQTHADFQGDSKNLVFSQCGTSVNDISRLLERRGKSMPTTGAADRQTIVGAISTGTHGSAIDVGSMQDHALALHLIVSDTRSVWIERASRPTLHDDFARALGVADEDILRDDDLFNAAVLSFGSFGIVHGIVVEATDIFYLQASRKVMPLNDAMWKAIEHLDFSELGLPRGDTRPFHFALVVNPLSQDKTYVTFMYKDDQKKPECKPPNLSSDVADGTAELVSHLMTLLPPITGGFQDLLLERFYPEYENVCGTHKQIFSVLTARGKGASVGMGIPLSQVRQAMGIVVREVKQYKAAILLQLRFLKASDALLASTQHQPYTCIFEIDGPRDKRVMKLIARIWKAFEKEGIHNTFHWGKVNNLNAENVKTIYGERLDKWLAARRQLLTPEMRTVFANRYLKELGMAD